MNIDKIGYEQEKYVNSAMYREDNRTCQAAELSGGRRLEIVSSVERKMHLGALSRADCNIDCINQGRRQREFALRIVEVTRTLTRSRLNLYLGGTVSYRQSRVEPR